MLEAPPNGAKTLTVAVVSSLNAADYAEKTNIGPQGRERIDKMSQMTGSEVVEGLYIGGIVEKLACGLCEFSMVKPQACLNRLI